MINILLSEKQNQKKKKIYIFFLFKNVLGWIFERVLGSYNNIIVLHTSYYSIPVLVCVFLCVSVCACVCRWYMADRAFRYYDLATV